MAERVCQECGAEVGTEHRLGCSKYTGVPEWLLKHRDDKGIVVMPTTSRESDELDDRALLSDIAFNRHSMNDGHHVSPSDNAMLQIGIDGIKVALAQGIDEEAFKRTLSAATRATIGLDMSDATALDAEQDWEEMLKGGLQTALETQTIVFAVGGVSRTCTHQLVRTRKAGFHQQSQRAGYMGDFPECRMPESVWKNVPARMEFFRAVMSSWRAYRRLCELDISYQDARFILPEGTTNFILLEYPIREFLNVYAYRGCSMFQWEIVHVMRECRRVLVEAHPWIEPYVKISCETTGPAFIKTGELTVDGEKGKPLGVTVDHHCTFQGWEEVEDQCDFPWALEEARTFKPEHHRITKTSPSTVGEK